MISPTTPQTWTPPSLYALIIPGSVVLDHALRTITAQRLIRSGAKLYPCIGYGLLSLRRPAGAACEGANVSHYLEAA